MSSSLACLPFLAALGLSMTGCADAPVPAPTLQSEPTFYQKLASADASVDPRAARDMISVYRRNNGLAGLSIDPALQQVAERQTKIMAAANNAGQGAGGPLNARLSIAGYKHGAAVENISAGYHTMAEAFSGWRQSQPHNANMLNPKVKRMGIATAYAPGTKYKVFWALVLTD